MHFLSNMTDIQLAASPHLKAKASNISYQETTSKNASFRAPKTCFQKIDARFLLCISYRALVRHISTPFSKRPEIGVVNQPPSHQPGVQLIKGIPTKGITTAVAQFLERNRGVIPE